MYQVIDIQNEAYTLYAPLQIKILFRDDIFDFVQKLFYSLNDNDKILFRLAVAITNLAKMSINADKSVKVRK